MSSSCSRKTLESKSSKVKDKHAESAQQQLLSGWMMTFTNFVLCRMYALDNLKFS